MSRAAPRVHDGLNPKCWCVPILFQLDAQNFVVCHRDQVARGLGLVGPWQTLWQNPEEVVEVIGQGTAG